MINIDVRNSTPIYKQIVEQIKENVLKGIIKPDEKIPSVREMAKILTLNPNTIQKAYQELERQRVIYIVQGKGAFISLDYKNKVDSEKIEELIEVFRKGIIDAYYLGINKKKMYELIENIYKEIEGDKID